jgi:hypothetical protein
MVNIKKKKIVNIIIFNLFEKLIKIVHKNIESEDIDYIKVLLKGSPTGGNDYQLQNDYDASEMNSSSPFEWEKVNIEKNPYYEAYTCSLIKPFDDGFIISVFSGIKQRNKKCNYEKCLKFQNMLKYIFKIIIFLIFVFLKVYVERLVLLVNKNDNFAQEVLCQG